MIVGGAALLHTSWILNSFYGFRLESTSCWSGRVCRDPDDGAHPDAMWPKTPVIGAWVQLATSEHEDADVVFLVATGPGQAAGLGLLIAGLVMRLVDPPVGADHSSSGSFTIAPTATADGIGLSLDSRF